jgi:hypothetical protein
LRDNEDDGDVDHDGRGAISVVVEDTVRPVGVEVVDALDISEVDALLRL